MTATISTVRTATPADEAEIWRLFMMAHRENGIFRLSPHKVSYFLQRALHPESILPTDLGPRGQIGVIGVPGKIEAIVFLILGEFWYSDEIHLEELLVYVDPECRKSVHARSCVAWMKKKSDDLGIKLVTGIISKHRTQSKIKLYDLLLPRAGAFYIYPLDDPDIKRMNHSMEKQAWLDAKRA